MSQEAREERIDRDAGEAERPVRHPIVIIDDDPLIRAGLAILFGDRFETRLCSSAKEGIAATDVGVCAVVLDVKMAGHDGFWACDEIRKISPTVPVIFYSAYQGLKDPYAIINDHRPFGYVIKGESAQKLIDMVEVAVKLQSTVVAAHEAAGDPDGGGSPVSRGP
jgi:DNA-binding NtrC family response regulator